MAWKLAYGRTGRLTSIGSFEYWLIRPCQHRLRARRRVAHEYAYACTFAFVACRRWAGLSYLCKLAGGYASCAPIFLITVYALLNRRVVFIREAGSMKQEARRLKHGELSMNREAWSTKHEARSTKHEARRTTHDARRTTHDVRRTKHETRNTKHETQSIQWLHIWVNYANKWELVCKLT